ncbi:MAG: hypothetical protein HOF27_14690, partial [Rhodospirillaceae bacterium]|nr:hypothetical protein [Rhodospirillaceae bacterium]
AHMSHELRTPLNCIIGFSQILMGEMFGPLGHANYLEYVGDVHTSGLHLLNVISDILDISKIEAGELEITDEQVNIGETLITCTKMMRERAERAQLMLSTEFAPNLPVLRADGLRIIRYFSICCRIRSNIRRPGAAFRLTRQSMSTRTWCLKSSIQASAFQPSTCHVSSRHLSRFAIVTFLQVKAPDWAYT